MLPWLVAAATALLLMLLPATAGASWRDDLAATADQTSQASAAEHKRRFDAPLRPHATHPLSTAVLDAVAADAESAYADGDRPRTDAVRRRMLVHDLAAAAGVQVLLLRGGDQAPLVGATADLLQADRRTAAIYLLVAAAAVLRVAAPFSADVYLPLLWITGLAWSAAVGLFVVHYGRMLSR